MTEQSLKKNLIYLTGFMASGKSTIGPILANTLGFESEDIDKIVEQRVGRSVREIFQEDGETYFRRVEKEVIREMSNQTNLVVSLGGGSVADQETFSIIKNSGILVYLRTSQEQLLKRLQHKTDRPVLSDSEGQLLTKDKLQERVQQLYTHREPIYSQAHLTIDTDNKKVGITVDEIVKKLTHLLR